jgi:hypothetical protein
MKLLIVGKGRKELDAGENREHRDIRTDRDREKA